MTKNVADHAGPTLQVFSPQTFFPDGSYTCWIARLEISRGFAFHRNPPEGTYLKIGLKKILVLVQSGQVVANVARFPYYFLSITSS